MTRHTGGRGMGLPRPTDGRGMGLPCPTDGRGIGLPRHTGGRGMGLPRPTGGRGMGLPRPTGGRGMGLPRPSGGRGMGLPRRRGMGLPLPAAEGWDCHALPVGTLSRRGRKWLSRCNLMLSVRFDSGSSYYASTGEPNVSKTFTAKFFGRWTQGSFQIAER